MEYSGHLIDLCEDILALWIYDELTKSQVVRCRKTRFGGVHVLLSYMFCKVAVELRSRSITGTSVLLQTAEIYSRPTVEKHIARRKAA